MTLVIFFLLSTHNTAIFFTGSIDDTFTVSVTFAIASQKASFPDAGAPFMITMIFVFHVHSSFHFKRKEAVLNLYLLKYISH